MKIQLQPLLAGFFALGLALDACGQDAGTVRLGFLLNFVRYTEWPTTVLKPDGNLNLCIAPGDDAMHAAQHSLSSTTVQGHPVKMLAIKSVDAVKQCHLLYLPTDLPPPPLSAWLQAARQTAVLTVSDLPDFIDQGGSIGLLSINGRYRFDINLGATQQADLQLRANLLKLARTVK